MVWEKDSSSPSSRERRGLCGHLAGHGARRCAIHRRTLPEVCQKFRIVSPQLTHSELPGQPDIPGLAPPTKQHSVGQPTLPAACRARGKRKGFGVSSQVSPQGTQQRLTHHGTDGHGLQRVAFHGTKWSRGSDSSCEPVSGGSTRQQCGARSNAAGRLGAGQRWPRGHLGEGRKPEVTGSEPPLPPSPLLRAAPRASCWHRATRTNLCLVFFPAIPR